MELSGWVRSERRNTRAGPRSNFFPSLSIASIVKMSSKTMLDEVVAMMTGKERVRAEHRGPDTMITSPIHRGLMRCRARPAPLRTYTAHPRPSFRLHEPQSGAPREVPIPLVFIASSGWDRTPRDWSVQSFFEWLAVLIFYCVGRPTGPLSSREAALLASSVT